MANAQLLEGKSLSTLTPQENASGGMTHPQIPQKAVLSSFYDETLGYVTFEASQNLLEADKKPFDWHDDPGVVDLNRYGHPKSLGSDLSYVQYSNTTNLTEYHGNVLHGGKLLPRKEQSSLEEPVLEPDKCGYKLSKYFALQSKPGKIFGKPCSKAGWTQKCKHGHVSFKPEYCGDSFGCPICNRSYAIRQGRKTFFLVVAGKPHTVGQLVLTFPEDTGFSELAEDKKQTERQIRSLVKAFMDREFAGYPYGCRVHSWATQNPFSKPHWHAHVLVVLMKHEAGRVVLGSGFKDVTGMRRTWRSVLGYHSEVNLYWEYAQITKRSPEQAFAKIRHWSNYLNRDVVLDANEFLMKNPSFTVTENASMWLAFHKYHGKNDKRLIWFGQLSDYRRSTYLEAVNSSLAIVHELIEEEAKETKRLFCSEPECDEELDPLGWRVHGWVTMDRFAKHSDFWSRYLYLTSRREPA